MIKIILTIGFIMLLVLAYSAPEFIYPEYERINYSGLTEPREKAYLDCSSIEAHIKTMEKIKGD